MSEGPRGGQDSRPGENPPDDAATARPEAPAPPEGDAYAWYQRGVELLGRRSPAAAAQLLERAADAEPQSRMVREALARAQFDAGWYGRAVESFRMIVKASPADDYAHFGLGLALARAGEPGQAAEYLALAAAMRPDLPHYSAALRDVRATLRARRERPGAAQRPGRAPEQGRGPGPAPEQRPGPGPEHRREPDAGPAGS